MRSIFMVLGTILFLTGCKREPKYIVVNLNADIKSKFYNKPKSYWIFKDSLNGELDSLYLEESVLKIDDGYQGDISTKYEELYLYFNSKHIGIDTSLKLILFIKFSMKGGNLLTCGLNKDLVQGLTFKFTYPQNKIYSVWTSDTLIYTPLKDPLILGANQFNNITLFSQSSKINISAASSGYWNNDLGLIKIRLLCMSGKDTLHRVLELQRWNLNQVK